MLHPVFHHNLIVIRLLIDILFKLLSQVLSNLLLIFSAILGLLLENLVSVIVMHDNLLLHLIFSLQRSPLNRPLIDVYDALSLHRVIVVVVEGLLDGLESLHYMRESLAERHRNVVPLHRLDLLHQVVNGQHWVVWPLVVAGVQGHRDCVVTSRRGFRNRVERLG